MTRRLTIIGVVLATLLAACGSSSSNDASSSEGKKYVNAMLSAKNSDSLRKSLSESQARCFAENLVNIVGVDTLKKANVSPADFAGNGADTKLKGKISKDKANQIADLVLQNKCFDFIDVVSKQASDSAFGKLPKAKQRCFYSELFKLPEVRSSLVSEFTGGTSNLGSALQNQSKVFTILGKCKIDPSALGG